MWINAGYPDPLNKNLRLSETCNIMSYCMLDVQEHLEVQYIEEGYTSKI